ncbi:unnamed protein product [Periconia digitata]|uniref:Uncharacterized protein n=1 Tax=Periconia digitata TaxID=1303443 RepID=A0A9W4XRC6_9PLEO|nr:unnamed protein product [Periconia digitata]
MASWTTYSHPRRTSTSTTITTTPKPTLRLQELRNEIYTLLLTPSTVPLSRLAASGQSHQTGTQHVLLPSSSPPSLYPAILSTCRKAAQEATPLLYTSHVFHAHNSLLTSFPHLTSASRPVLHHQVISMIRRWHITLRLDTDPRFTAEQAKLAFSGVEYLEVRVWEAQFEMCDYLVLGLLSGVRGVRVARVGGSVGEGVARWLERVMMSEEGVDQGVKKEEILELGKQDWRVAGHFCG